MPAYLRSLGPITAFLIVGLAPPGHAQIAGIAGDPGVLAALAGGAVSASPMAIASAPVAPLPTMPGMPTTASPVVTITPPALANPGGPPLFNYQTNLASNAFGATLFTGAFARSGTARFDPDYVVAVGDSVLITLWGGYSFQQVLALDAQGNVFLPSIGAVHLAGVRNRDLQSFVEHAVATAFRSNVKTYATMAAAQPVKVFVGGFVNRPGVFDGSSMDSLLHYLDLAGGIDTARGSLLNVEVRRGTLVRARVNLYDFLVRGVLPQVQLADGDVIFVAQRQQTITVSGAALNPYVFEFMQGAKIPAADVIALAQPLASATHMRAIRSIGPVLNADYYDLAQAGTVVLDDGDSVEFTADKKPGTITVRVAGEHDSAQAYVLPYGARLGDVLAKVHFNASSDRDGISLFRQSVQARQQQMLTISLNSLAAAALTARSGTTDESVLRKNEADMVLQWIARAQTVQPLGQVAIGSGAQADDLLLENGDVIQVPTRDGVVLVSGDVLFPNAIAYDRGAPVARYVAAAGGFTQVNGARRIVLAHRNGTVTEVGPNDGGVRSGDTVLVLPKPDVKSREIFKDISQILYQIAISARVVLGL